MIFPSGITRNFKLILSNLIWICIAGYFTYHILSGARGFLSWNKLDREMTMLSDEFKHLKYENEFLENKVSRIRDDNLDLDLLEEQAQNILGFFKKDSIVVLLPRYD